jgi:hypothetical protein
MLEGIANIIIEKIIAKVKPAMGVSRTTTKDNAVQGVTPGGLQTNIQLEQLRISGMTKQEVEHVSQIIKKLMKEDKEKKTDGKAMRTKSFSQEVEKQLNRYLTKKEKELLGILINKLV